MAFAGGVGADLTGLGEDGRPARRGAAVLGIADAVYRRSDGGERGGVRGVRRRRAADAAGPDVQGTAAADRGGERRMGGVGGAGGPQGSVAEADAVLSGDVPRATCCACLSGEHPASFSSRVMFRDRPADRSCDLTAADGRRLDRRRPRIIRGLGANQAEVDQGAPARNASRRITSLKRHKPVLSTGSSPGIESYTVHTAVGLPQSAMHCNRRR